MTKILDQFIQKLKKELGLLLSISLGIFLFVLFFQPFPLMNTDFNNRTLVVAGLGDIVFLFMVLVRILIPWITGVDREEKGPLLSSSFSNLIIMLLSSIEKLHSKSGNHWLTLKGFDEPLPVSRQYLLKLQEVL